MLAGLETGIVMLLMGDSAILAKALFFDRFGQTLSDFFTGITDNKYVFLLLVNVLLLAVGDLHRAAAGALHPGALPGARSPSASTASTRSTSG